MAESVRVLPGTTRDGGEVHINIDINIGITAGARFMSSPSFLLKMAPKGRLKSH
jgi:hypothetical protein